MIIALIPTWLQEFEKEAGYMTDEEWEEEIIAEEVAGAINRFKKERPYALHSIAIETAREIIKRLKDLGLKE